MILLLELSRRRPLITQEVAPDKRQSGAKPKRSEALIYDGLFMARHGPKLDVRKHLQQISVRITEEQRAMSKDLVSGP